ncbi:epoxide hydrolase [Aspergillus undulatus]|uniref:epoxide hydrolase n=1 Tax=Aspergillus undulatus TaxID=1810928 RepID=UPI003CCD5161
MAPNPFEIAVPKADLDRLHQKLAAATFPDELDSARWDMGVIKRLSAYWKDGFEWQEQVRKLNEQFKQFTVSVSVDGFDDLEIHYLHHISKTLGAIPLLFFHGWPGSFIEATKLIRLLTSGDRDKPAFDVVAPSLPNFGFSSARGFGLHQYAEAMHKVMIALGYKEYGLRINCLELPQKGSGYMIQKATRPQTLGYGLSDSPVAFLAWIYDKLHDWTDDYPWSDDEILTWVSIYVFSTAGPAASTRIYFEASEDESVTATMSKPAPASVKVGVAQFKAEIWRHPLSLAGELREMFGRNGKAFGVVGGRNGFE